MLRGVTIPKGGVIIQILLKLLSAQVALQQPLKILEAQPLRRQFEHFLNELHLSAYHHHIHQSPPEGVKSRTHERQLHLFALLAVQDHFSAYEVRLPLEVRSSG